MLVCTARTALIVVSFFSSSASAQSIPKKYDAEIERAVKRWWVDFPHWKAWKAQLFQESRLDPNAVSPVGARGLAQFMPGTWRDVAGSLRLVGSPHDDAAIEAGAFYMAKLRRTWSGRNRTGEQRNRLGQASYNAGTGNILGAQSVCNNALEWEHIAPCMIYITGAKNAHETITYVERIDRYWKRLELE